MADFRVEIHDDVRKAKEWMLAVFRESVQRTVEDAQTPVGHGGNMPVDTGFLRSSGQMVLNGEPPGLQANPNPAGSFSYDAGATSLVIASAKLGDKLTFAYTANYAIFQNYGARGRAGRMFVDLACQKWGQTVEAVSREADARSGG